MEEIIIKIDEKEKSLLFNFLDKSHIEYEELEDRILSNLASGSIAPVSDERKSQIEKELRGE